MSAFAEALSDGTPGVYVNFLGNEGTVAFARRIRGDTWARLAEVKRQYEPTNLFRLNQNIQPEAEA